MSIVWHDSGSSTTRLLFVRVFVEATVCDMTVVMRDRWTAVPVWHGLVSNVNLSVPVCHNSLCRLTACLQLEWGPSRSPGLHLERSAGGCDLRSITAGVQTTPEDSSVPPQLSEHMCHLNCFSLSVLAVFLYLGHYKNFYDDDDDVVGSQYVAFLYSCQSPVLLLSDLGYRWAGAVPEPWCSVLPWCRLLYTGLWCDVIQLIPFTWQLERRVPDPGESSRPGPLPICRHWQQNWSRLSRGQLTYHVTVIADFPLNIVQSCICILYKQTLLRTVFRLMWT